MKFLNVYCEERKEDVYINLDKIVMITRLADAQCKIEIAGNESGPVIVALSAEDIIRKINGEERAGIGFRTNR